MAIYTLNKTGQFHKTHTEDHVITMQLGNEWIIGAVMDGCSSGKESYFASTLFGKIIQKSVRMLSYSKIPSSDPRTGKMGGASAGRFILKQIFDNLAAIHKLLETDLIEMLTTLLLLVYNKKDKSAWVNISGDGFIIHDHQIIEVDQNNIPDYMAYHLDTTFNNWIEHFSKTYAFENQTDISISTDGISKFITHNHRRPQDIDPVHYLLIDDSHQDSGNMLETKFQILAKEYGLFPYDDLGMIRIIIR